MNLLVLAAIAASAHFAVGSVSFSSDGVCQSGKECSGAEDGLAKVENASGSFQDEESDFDSAEEEEVAAIPFEEVSGDLRIAVPANGSENAGRAVAVRLHVDTNVDNTTRFLEKFNHSDVCLSVDDSSFACWPIFHISRFPLFTNMSYGVHRIVAKLVDPQNGRILLDGKIAESTFSMVPPNNTEAEPRSDATKPEPESNSEEPTKAQVETIPMPQVGITYPIQTQAVSPSFPVKMHIHTGANLTVFRKMFENSFICLALDGAVQQSCWPIFEQNYSPKFVNLTAGEHLLQAHIAHPQSLEIVDGSSKGPLRFWVSEKEDKVVPMYLREPSQNSNSFGDSFEDKPAREHLNMPTGRQEETQGSVTLQINVDGRRHQLVVTKDADFLMDAARFCVKHDIVGQNCVSVVKRMIEIEWEKARDLPHLEFQTQQQISN